MRLFARHGPDQIAQHGTRETTCRDFSSPKCWCESLPSVGGSVTCHVLRQNVARAETAHHASAPILRIMGAIQVAGPSA